MMDKRQEGGAHGITALLVLDVFSTFDFPGGDELFSLLVPVIAPMQALIWHFRKRGRPVIYANDNAGRWQDDFDGMLSHVRQSGMEGAAVVHALAPVPSDYRMLKPRHSAFFETPLPSLLHHLDARTLVVCGIATDSCVLATVLDAHVRGLVPVVPADTTASQTEGRTERTLIHLRESCGVSTPISFVLPD